MNDSEQGPPTDPDFRESAPLMIGRRFDEVSGLSRSVLDVTEPGRVEAMWLATGRLRAALEFYRSALEGPGFRPTRREVRELASVARDRRTLDSAISLYSEISGEMDDEGQVALGRILDRLDERRARVNRELADRASAPRLQALRLRIEDLIPGPLPETERGAGRADGLPRELPKVAVRVVSKRLAALRESVPEALEYERTEARSRALASAARLRFVLELAGLALGGQADTARRASRGLQEVLASIGDCDQALPEAEAMMTALLGEDEKAIVDRAKGSRELDPLLVQASPNRSLYRGLALAEVHLRARRRIEFQRLQRLWQEQARQGVWVALEGSLTQS